MAAPGGTVTMEKTGTKPRIFTAPHSCSADCGHGQDFLELCNTRKYFSAVRQLTLSRTHRDPITGQLLLPEEEMGVLCEYMTALRNGP